MITGLIVALIVAVPFGVLQMFVEIASDIVQTYGIRKEDK